MLKHRPLFPRDIGLTDICFLNASYVWYFCAFYVILCRVYFSSAIADDNEKFGRGPNIVESSSIVPLMPGSVVQAFSLLQESPEAQVLNRHEFLNFHFSRMFYFLFWFMGSAEHFTFLYENAPVSSSLLVIWSSWLCLQSIAASLACDKNVWDAVMKNEKVMEVYRNHQPSSA